MRISLSAAVLAKLQKPVRGQGGFQSLLRKLQRQIDGSTLDVDAADVERLFRYSIAYGGGGFQQRTKATAAKRGTSRRKR
jgi:hypothetical protein